MNHEISELCFTICYFQGEIQVPALPRSARLPFMVPSVFSRPGTFEQRSLHSFNVKGKSITYLTNVMKYQIQQIVD